MSRVRTGFEQGAERQASAGARDGVKGKGRTLGARALLHALVGPRDGFRPLFDNDDDKGRVLLAVKQHRAATERQHDSTLALRRLESLYPGLGDGRLVKRPYLLSVSSTTIRVGVGSVMLERWKDTEGD